MDNQTQREIHYLMRFFVQPQTEQWKQVPDEFPEVIFDQSPYYAKTKEPIEFLSLVLVSLTHGIGYHFNDENLVETLFEAYVVMDSFMLESYRDVVFTKRDEPEQLDYIWKTFGRICGEALKFESLTRFDATELNFDYFVKKYAIIE